MKLRIASDSVVHETVDGEVVILDEGRGLYYSLTGSGAEIWSLLVARCAKDEIIETLVARHPDAQADIPAVVNDLVQRLLAEELIASVADAEAGVDVILAPVTGPFVPPRFERYTDLQNLLLLDPIHDVESTGWPKASSPE